MKTFEIASATAATALAIARATNNDANANSQQLASNLRISNLEKLTKRQEQKSNELIKELRNKRTQKNLNGSHNTGLVAPPEHLTLTRNKNKQKQSIIDLSSDDPDKTILQHTDLTSSPAVHLKRAMKRQWKGKPPQPHGKKRIQWKEAELKLYNP